jgi:predicted nucleic acid-binding protein
VEGLRVVLDTSVVVGCMDKRDALHKVATALWDALDEAGAESIFLDCVVVETVGVICRRQAERRVKTALPDLHGWLPAERITPAYSLLYDAWDEMVDRVLRSNGKLSPHDVLILDWARRADTPVATFDGDMRGDGVTILSSAADVRALGH